MLIHSREITVGKIDPTRTAQARRMLAEWLQERRDAPREITVDVEDAFGKKTTSVVRVAITVERDNSTKSNVYRLRKVE